MTSIQIISALLALIVMAAISGLLLSRRRKPTRFDLTVAYLEPRLRNTGFRKLETEHRNRGDFGSIARFSRGQTVFEIVIDKGVLSFILRAPDHEVFDVQAEAGAAQSDRYGMRRTNREALEAILAWLDERSSSM